MSNIPTVPGSEISYDTPAKAVPLNAGALAAARYRGAEALGRGMEDIGNEAGALAEHLQKARELGIAADVDLKLRTARQTFLESLKGDSNEQDWVNRAQVTATETRDYIYASHDGIPQRMRPQIDAALKGWEGSLLTETQTLSNVQTVNRAWGSVQKDVRDAVDNGHADHAFTLLEQARQKKLTDPAVIDQMQRDIPKGIAQTYIERGFSANPQQTTELLKSGGSLPAEDQDGKPIVPKNIFTPKEMEALINTGRIRSDAWQRTNFETMLREDQDPVTGLVPEAVIKQKMTSKEITEKAGQNQIAAQDRKVKATTAEAAHLLKLEDDRLEGNLLTRIHDPTAWGVNPDTYAHQLVEDAGAISNPLTKARMINDVNRQLASVKKKGETEEAPFVKQQLEFLKKDFETRTAVTPVTGVYVHGGAEKIASMSKTDLETEFGKGANREGLMRRANAWVEQQRGVLGNETKQLLDFAKANPDATPDELKAERERIQAPEIHKRVNRAFSVRTAPSPQDEKAWEWAMGHSKDPLAQAIFEKLSQ